MKMKAFVGCIFNTNLRLVILGVILTLIACNPNENPSPKVEQPDNVDVEHLDRIARNLIVTVTTDIGIPVGQGTFHAKKSEKLLMLQPFQISFRSSFPAPMSVLLENVKGELFQFPLTIGQTWQERKIDRRVKVQSTLEKHEPVETPLGNFKQCLKHKTVLTDASKLSQVENDLINGTRYLWFAKGVGMVKMRYEHSNGIVTEAELIDYKVQGKSEEYLPTTSGTTWTYRWKNDYYNEILIENVHLKSGNEFNAFGNVVAELTVKTEDGENRSRGRFYIKKTQKYLMLLSSQLTLKSPISDWLIESPIPYSAGMLLYNVSSGLPEKGLLLFPLTVGKTWNQTNQWIWKTQENITLEGYESVKVSAGTFPHSLIHKTILSGANTAANAKEKEQKPFYNTLISGTRYLWFAKGVGLVKMRYEHSNGMITEAELMEYHVPRKSEEYFPLNLGTSWTYKWQNDYHVKPLIEKIEVVEAGSGNETPLKEAKYTVAMDADKPGIMQVTCKLIPQDPNSNKVRLALNGDDSYITKVNLSHSSYYTYTSTLRNGKVWEFKLDRQYESELKLRYEASIEHGSNRNIKLYQESGIKSNPAKLPYAREDCVSWPGNMLFIVGRQCDDITVEFKLPKGWHASAPWQRIGKRGHKFSVKNQMELTEPYLLIGKHTEVVAKSGNTQVALAIGGSLKTSKDEIQNSVQEFISAYSELFSGEPTAPLLFIVNPYEEKLGKRMEGHGSGRSITVQMDRNLAETNRHEWGPFLAHEVFHIWNGLTALENFNLMERWFKEGVTDFYADITATRLGYLSEREYLNRLEHACEAYLSAPSKYTITNSDDRRLVYNGGSLVTAALDFEIRELTENKKSFDDVMKQMYHKYNHPDKMYIQQDIIMTVNSVGGKDFEPFFNTYVAGKDRLPLTEYFSKAGLNALINDSEELPTSAYVADVIRISLARETPVNVNAVNGMRIRTSKELRKLAKEWKSGDVLELTYGELEQDDKYKTEQVTLSGILENPPTMPEVSVRITKMEKITELQRAILAGILGKKN